MISLFHKDMKDKNAEVIFEAMRLYVKTLLDAENIEEAIINSLMFLHISAARVSKINDEVPFFRKQSDVFLVCYLVELAKFQYDKDEYELQDPSWGWPKKEKK